MKTVDYLKLAVAHATGKVAHGNDYHEKQFANNSFKDFVGILPIKQPNIIPHYWQDSSPLKIVNIVN